MKAFIDISGFVCWGVALWAAQNDNWRLFGQAGLSAALVILWVIAIRERAS